MVNVCHSQWTKVSQTRVTPKHSIKRKCTQAVSRAKGLRRNTKRRPECCRSSWMLTTSKAGSPTHLDGHEHGAHMRRCSRVFVGWRIVGILPETLAGSSVLFDADGRARRGLIMSFGTFFRYYDDNLLLDATDTSIGLIGGIQAFMVLLLSFIVGRLLDAKFHRVIVGVGGFLTWLGYFCLSFNILQGPENQGSYGLIILTQSIIAGASMSYLFSHSSHCAIQVRKQSAQCHIWTLTSLLSGFHSISTSL